jgi:hypothetical protein
MNQEQVKEKLLKLNRNIEDFSLIFSGKKSRKVNGLYKPETREIIIHNRNFSSDNPLIYTAIHEFAHHIHFTGSPVPISSRAHTKEFWGIFHSLLFNAEEQGIYTNIFETNEEFIELTREIKNNYLSKNGELMKDLGRLLIRAISLCEKHGIIFNDYIDRGLKLSKSTANTLIKIHTMDITPEIGFDNMKVLSQIKDPKEREEIEKAFVEGETADMIEVRLSKKSRPDDSIELLEKEKKRIIRTIESLNKKLAIITAKINSLKS